MKLRLYIFCEMLSYRSDDLLALSIQYDSRIRRRILHQYALCDRRFNCGLQITFQRTCAEYRIVAFVSNESLCSFGSLELELTLSKTFCKRVELQISDLTYLISRQRFVAASFKDTLLRTPVLATSSEGML